MFFGPSVKVWFGGLLATHPSLEERIQRVHPRFQRSEYRAKRSVAPLEPAKESIEQKGRRAGDIATAWGRSAAQSAALVGTVDAGKLDLAARLLAGLPAELQVSVRTPDGAAAALVALLLADSDEAMRKQLEAMGQNNLAERARAATSLTRGLALGFHLPLIDLALATLKPASAQQKQDLVAALEAVVAADRRVSLHEFVVLALVRSQLMPRPRPPQNRRIAELKAEAATVLSLLAHAGTRPDAKGAREGALRAAIQAGAQTLGIPAETAVSLNLEAANAALEALRGLAPMQKGVLVKGLFAAVTLDGTIRVAEAGLMRLVGAMLDCPLPPLFDSLDPASLSA